MGVKTALSFLGGKESFEFNKLSFSRQVNKIRLLKFYLNGVALSELNLLCFIIAGFPRCTASMFFNENGKPIYATAKS